MRGGCIIVLFHCAISLLLGCASTMDETGWSFGVNYENQKNINLERSHEFAVKSSLFDEKTWGDPNAMELEIQHLLDTQNRYYFCPKGFKVISNTFRYVEPSGAVMVKWRKQGQYILFLHWLRVVTGGYGDSLLNTLIMPSYAHVSISSPCHSRLSAPCYPTWQPSRTDIF